MYPIISHSIMCSLAFAIIALSGCNKTSDEDTTEQANIESADSASVSNHPMNCLIVVLDAFHAKNSSLYGFPEPTTPHIDKWAEKGIVFDHASSQFISTSTSSWSYLNGRYPYHSKGISRMRDDDVPIAELFQQAGYRTAGFSDNPFVNESQGTDKGFDDFHYYAFKDKKRLPATMSKRNEVSQRLFDELSQWVQNEHPEPWFAYLHTLRPHNPYPAQEPYLSEFADTSSVPAGEDAQDYFYELEKATVKNFYGGGYSPEFIKQLEIMHRLYLGNIANVDAMLDALLDALDDAGQLENTFVVIMSDHGEAFGEHKNWGHSKLAPYSEVTHVPFVIIPPASLGIEPGRISTSVELTDLLPTLADIFALSDSMRRDGQSLAPLLRNEDGYSKPAIFSQSEFQLSVTQNNQKLIYKIYDRYVFPMPTMLFNLDDDPDEKANLFPDNTLDELLLEIGQQYVNAQNLNEGIELRELTEEEIEVMESLGYVN